MRQPTPDHVLYAWHRSAMLDPGTPRQDGVPEAGWYRMQLVKNGPWVAVEIWCERELDPDTGELQSPERLTGSANGNLLSRDETEDAWTRMRPISRDDYGALLRRIAATPGMHNPYQPIDLTKGTAA